MEQEVYKTLDQKDLQTISCGSGVGTYEQSMNPKTICIDPDPTSHQELEKGQIPLWPKYKTIYEFIKSNDYKHSGPRCLLLLNPYPSYPLFPEAGYDYESIRLLQPNYILIMACRGDSGSNDLWNWIDNKQQARDKQGYKLIVHKTTVLKAVLRPLKMEYMLFSK